MRGLIRKMWTYRSTTNWFLVAAEDLDAFKQFDGSPYVSQFIFKMDGE